MRVFQSTLKLLKLCWVNSKVQLVGGSYSLGAIVVQPYCCIYILCRGNQVTLYIMAQANIRMQGEQAISCGPFHE